MFKKMYRPRAEFNTGHSLSRQQAPTNIPSGIAQLRKTSEQNAEHSDSMNLDDFIFSENVSTPAGMSPPRETKDREQNMSSAVATAIPIKLRKEPAIFVPQSVPIGQHGLRGNEEFGYVQKHVRKTSIDERRVSFLFRIFYKFLIRHIFN